MARTTGRRTTRIGLIDGPVLATHPGLAGADLELPARQGVSPAMSDVASHHATSVAGILVARRESGAPGICPGATLVIRAIFPSAPSRRGGVTTARPSALAAAIVETADAGIRILNLSLTLSPRGYDTHRVLERALDHAAARGLVVVAAAGNHGTIGGSVITRHPSVIPVVAYGLHGHPVENTNSGPTIGRRGVGAAGAGIVSLGADGGLRPFGGTSAAAALVTGVIALLWSEFPDATSADLTRAVTRSTSRRSSVVPPLVNAWRAYEILGTRRHR
ncbi:S8 family peptidase [Herbidospora mongoliensis]|uniref:S8 family peptidase n=1 Tax=Herbidospora mongoliensis TaxID=688067 RepID=UPI001C3F1A83|nr:S8 family serine peptidase [Herbidospora mongoliensis]